MRKCAVLLTLGLFVIVGGCQWLPPLSSPPLSDVSEPPEGTPAASVSAEESRFGLDYVFPLQSQYQSELWPRRFAEAGLQWVNFADVSWKALEPRPPQGGVHR